MKKVLIICMSVICVFIGIEKSFAENIWTVKTVPNTRLESNDIHVSDPDGFLSDSTEMTINTALGAIRDKADVFLVTLASIGDAEPKPFATELLNYWGIGDAETDNGVLLLFVEDQHALEFETGYGAEETLTDAKCQRIFTNTIVPFFRAGDYEGGLCAGVADIVEVYGGEVPMGLKTTLPSHTADDSSGGSDIEDMGAITLLVFLLITVMPIVALVYWVKKKKEKTMAAETIVTNTEEGITYIEGAKTSWSGSPWEGKGCLGALMIGFSIFMFYLIAFTSIAARYPDMPEKTQTNIASVIALVLYLTWMCFRQGRRTLKVADTLAKQSVNPLEVYQAASNHKANKIAFWMAPWLGWYYRKKLKNRILENDECQCPTCRAKMKKDSCFKLPETHFVENRIGALHFQPYRCPNGHAFVLKDKGKHYSDYSTCPKCSAYTLKKIHTTTLKEADYSHSGEKEETYECQHCGHSFTKKVVIPKLVHYSSSSYSSSSSGSSYSSSSYSHSSSSGSFGGGHSGGGGYSGRW